jgi:methyl-accepting chemotaxis protein
VRMTAAVSTGMVEQTTAIVQISRSAESMKGQSEQAAKALQEQSRAMKDMSDAAENTARQIKMITSANREHSTVSGGLLVTLKQIRDITDRNAHGVKETRGGTTDLLERAAALVSLTESHTGARQARGNGGSQHRGR